LTAGPSSFIYFLGLLYFAGPFLLPNYIKN